MPLIYFKKKTVVEAIAAIFNYDPYWDNVVLMMHGEDFSDAKSHVITSNGGAISSSIKKFGSGSLQCNGSGYFSTPYITNDFNWWTSDFTIEMFVYINAHSETSGGNHKAVQIGNCSTTDAADYWSFGTIANGTVQFYYFNNVTNYINGTTQLATGMWHHIAMVKTGSSIKLFANGNLEVTAAVSGVPLSSATYNLSIGKQNNVTFNGYIDELRITKGIARYTSNFSVPTTAFPSVIELEYDWFWNNTVLEIKGGSSLPFIDETGLHTLTAIGGATVSTSTKKNGVGSLAFNGSSDYLNVSTSSQLSLGTSDFTIEAWIYTTSLSTYRDICACRGATGTSFGFNFTITPTGALTAYAAGTMFTTGNLIAANTWYHVALSKSGGYLRVFVNGSIVANVADVNNYSNNTWTIGSYNGGGEYFAGYIDDFRITKGVGRYTTNFTPKSTEYATRAPIGTELSPTEYDPYWNQVVLSMPMNNVGTSFRDIKNHAFTAAGNVVQSTSFYKFGGVSAYFDGAGDYISTPASSDFTFGTGNFTVEAFVYKNNNGSNQVVLSKWDGGGTGWGIMCYGSDRMSWTQSSGYALLVAPAQFPFGQWCHLAVTRASGTLRIFINGVIVASVTDSANYNSASATLVIGALDTSGNFPWNGYIDDLRITKGVARYTSNFSVPTTANITYGASF